MVLAFGDSLTYGTGAAPGLGYPEQLARRTGLRVINAGRPGELSSAGVERLPALLERHRPALVLICHGGNDLLRLESGKTLQLNLSRMVKLAQASGAAVALIGVPRPGLLLSVPTLYREVAEQAGVPLEAEALAELEGEETLKADAVHLNGAGYGALAAAVEVLLRKSGALPE